jgi:hypothetical protein
MSIRGAITIPTGMTTTVIDGLILAQVSQRGAKNYDFS